MQKPTTEACRQCSRLLQDYLSALRATRKLLETADRAERSGVVDDLGYLETDKKLVDLITRQRLARKAYERHRREQHG
jgi:hypothetical protein